MGALWKSKSHGITTNVDVRIEWTPRVIDSIAVAVPDGEVKLRWFANSKKPGLSSELAFRTAGSIEGYSYGCDPGHGKYLIEHPRFGSDQAVLMTLGDDGPTELLVWRGTHSDRLDASDFQMTYQEAMGLISKEHHEHERPYPAPLLTGGRVLCCQHGQLRFEFEIDTGPDERIRMTWATGHVSYVAGPSIGLDLTIVEDGKCWRLGKRDGRFIAVPDTRRS